MQIARFRGAALALTLLAGSATTALAANEGVAQTQVEMFVEVPGSMEFTGRVIAKPLQFETLADRGLSQNEISTTIGQAKALLAQYAEHWYEPLVDHHVILVPNGMTDNEFIAQLADTGLFEFVEPDWMLFPIGCPNDSLFNSQWHHQSNRMQSCLAWDIHTGSPATTIGTCDTGVDLDHSDLLSHRKEGYNAVNRQWENNGGQIQDINGHGTHVTGCSGANGNNNNGVSGAGWNFSHRMMRVSNSSGGSASLSDLTHGALTSIQAGDKVANVSYSGVNSSSVRSTASTIKGLGGLMCWAAGNDGRNLNWGDRDDDDVIVVGSTTSSDSRSSFSAFGRSVDLMAPGSSILSTTNGGGYANFSGTSMATPVCAGVIALIWDYNPGLSPDEVEDILKQGADDLGSSGVDDTFGYGRVNSYESLLLAGGEPNNPPEIIINSPTDGGEYALGASVSFSSTVDDIEDGDISGQVTWTSTIDGLIGTGNFSTTSLSEGLHFIEVEVADSNGATDYQLISINVVDGGGIPALPILGTALEGPNGVITFTWSDQSGNETGFEVQRQEKVGGVWQAREDVGTTGPNTEVMVDNVPESLNGWRYRVRANGAGGDSAWTANQPVKVKRPVNYSGSLNGSSVDLIWTDRSDLETGMEVWRQEYREVNGRLRWQAKVLIDTLAPNATSYTDTPGSGEWRWRIRATSETLNSEFSTNVRLIVP